MQNFTNEQLLRYIYNEMKDTQRADLEKELRTNWALKEKLRVFTEAKDKLSQVRIASPRRQSVDAILQYAQGMSEVVSR